MSAHVLARLLRSPGEVAKACRDDATDVATIASFSLGATILGAAAFGGVVGSFRGGHQILYGAAKVPIAILATLCLAAPAFHAIAAVLGRPWPMRSIIALALAAAGRSSLVLLAFAPALWLVYDFGMGYHSAAVSASVAYAIAGIAALSVLVRGLGDGPGRFSTALAFMAVFFMVGGQTAWILRPYLVRPRTTSIPFLRDREGSFIESVVTSLASANGLYSSNSYERERSFDEPQSFEPEIDERPRRVRSIDEAP